jgi:hypothetical protein
MMNLTGKPVIALFCRTVTGHCNSRIWFSPSPLALSLAGKIYIMVIKKKQKKNKTTERNLKLHFER